MTTQGAAGPLAATDTLDAARACLLYGQVYISNLASDSARLTNIRNGDKAAYKYIDFGAGVDSVEISVAPGANPGKIDLALDQLWHPSIGVIRIPGDGNGKSWITLKVAVNHPNGIHALLLRFSVEGEDSYKINWIKFDRK